MSNKKHNDSLITDEKTLMRRAWIDLALSSVRSQLKFGVLEGRETAETTIAAGYETAAPEAATEKRERHLYLAYSAGKARTRCGS